MIEVVIIITIIGLLVGLTLPAVMMAREAAARRRCQSNLRQIALAAVNYESAHGVLPPGYLGDLPPVKHSRKPDYNERFQWAGVLPYLLPYLEQEPLYRGMEVQWDVTKADRPWWVSEANFQAASVRLPVLVCPSDDPFEGIQRTVWYVAYFAALDGKAYEVFQVVQFSRLNSDVLGRTSYVGSAGRRGHTGISEEDIWEGVFSNRSRTRMNQVSTADGTSNVLFFGESLGGKYPGVREESYCWMGVGVSSSIFGLPLQGNFPSFSSRHTVVHFAFCDGSVRGLRKGCPTDLFIRLSAYHDGLPTSASDAE
jgi:hypothetical protein